MPTNPLRRCSPGTALLLLLLAVATASGATYSLNAPAGAVAAASRVSLELIVLNPGTAAAEETLPATLAGRLDRGDRVWNVTLRPAAAGVHLTPGGFALVSLELNLPADAAGRLFLELEQPQRLRTVLEVERSAALATDERPADYAGSEIVRQPVVERPSLTRFERYYADHFSPHEPMYFLFGDTSPAAKFQISMKYRLLSDGGPLATALPMLRGVHVAYTQRSLWDITSNSSPFYDSSYLPELLFQSLVPELRPRGGLRWVGWQAAFQHESNGRDGAGSRSLNYFYFRPLLVLGDLAGWRILLRPKLQLYTGDLSDNPDIRSYRGNGEMRVVIGHGNRLALSILGRMGNDFSRGGLQVDLSYPTVFMSGNFAMYLQLQYWTGYGESLLNYNGRSEALRAGFSLAR